MTDVRREISPLLLWSTVRARVLAKFKHTEGYNAKNADFNRATPNNYAHIFGATPFSKQQIER